VSKIVMIVVATALVLCLAVPASLAAKPAKELETGSECDLPVFKLSADLDGESSLKGNPHGTPPGQDKPKPPDGGEEPTANKWAVVVGIADYQGRGNDLWHPDEDAKEMKEALINKYGFPKDNIKTLLNRQATAQAIVDAIDWLATNEDADSTVVFFFSGHGFRVADGADGADGEGWDDDFEKDGYDEGIVTYDLYGLPDGLSEDYVTLGNEFKNFESQKFALIFGSCFSGGMFDDNDDLQAPGRVICSACEAYQYGWDYLLLGNTLFGYYFVDEAILQGKADGAEWYGLHTSGDKDGQVSMEEALAYAYPRVIAEEPDSQPQIYDGFAGELIP